MYVYTLQLHVHRNHFLTGATVCSCCAINFVTRACLESVEQSGGVVCSRFVWVIISPLLPVSSHAHRQNNRHDALALPPKHNSVSRFYRVSMLTRDIYIANLSVRPSVCPLRSGIRWKRLNISSQFFSPYGSPIILVLPASNIFTKFRRGHPLRGAKYRWGRKNSRFSTNKSLYLANDKIYKP